MGSHLNALCKAMAANHPKIIDESMPSQDLNSSENEITALVQLRRLWPYDGFDVTLESWEATHYLMVRDVLRCKWPQNKHFGDAKLWKALLSQFAVFGAD